jgi:hypothetical protein
VREAAERWPAWWYADLFGPPHREADLAVLEELHEGLRRLRLVRRRGRKLHATVRGRELAADPVALLCALASDLGGGDPFCEMVADEIVDKLSASAPCSHEQLVAPALAASVRGGWADPAGVRPSEHEVSWVVAQVVCRAQAYGLIEHSPAPDDPPRWPSRISLSEAASIVRSWDRGPAVREAVFVFDAQLVDAPEVCTRVAVAAHDPLSGLHRAIQLAFGWDDDCLYSFWLDGRFWGDESEEYGRPGVTGSGRRTAAVPVDELDLQVGAKIAYVFDYGEEWRVMLTLLERSESSARA